MHGFGHGVPRKRGMLCVLDWVDPHYTRRLGFPSPLSRAVYFQSVRPRCRGTFAHFTQRRSPIGSAPGVTSNLSSS
jgi:hypothetical protein